ncbi:hypothetical protein Droror1_Dr00011569 [Drosera rotundifolia]
MEERRRRESVSEKWGLVGKGSGLSLDWPKTQIKRPNILAFFLQFSAMSRSFQNSPGSLLESRARSYLFTVASPFSLKAGDPSLLLSESKGTRERNERGTRRSLLNWFVVRYLNWLVWFRVDDVRFSWLFPAVGVAALDGLVVLARTQLHGVELFKFGFVESRLGACCGWRLSCSLNVVESLQDEQAALWVH